MTRERKMNDAIIMKNKNFIAAFEQDISDCHSEI